MPRGCLCVGPVIDIFTLGKTFYSHSAVTHNKKLF